MAASSSAVGTMTRDIGKYFIRQDVQQLLRNLTGFDLNKIYSVGFNVKSRFSRMELLNDEQLQAERERVTKKALRLLQVPPMMRPREPCDKVLAEDKRLEPLNLKKTSYLFTDISMNVPHKNRMVVVRESNGKLRKASHEERERMIDVYFPIEGRPFLMPAMFEPKNLEECLKLKHYLLVLKKACIKMEPNDPEFIRITNRVYEYVNEAKDFDLLYSSRFFGALVFYVAWYRKADNLMEWYLLTDRLKEANDFIKLFNKLNDRAATAADEQTNDDKNNDQLFLQNIQQFIEKELQTSNSNVKEAFERQVRKNRLSKE